MTDLENPSPFSHSRAPVPGMMDFQTFQRVRDRIRDRRKTGHPGEVAEGIRRLLAPHSGQVDWPLQIRIALEIRRWRILPREIAEEMGIPPRLERSGTKRPKVMRAALPVHRDWLTTLVPSHRPVPREIQIRVFLAVLRVAARRAREYADSADAARQECLVALDACMAATE